MSTGYNTAMDLTTTELAEKAGVSLSYVGKEIRTGRLKARKAGYVWLVSQEDAEKWLNNPRRGSRSRKVKGGDADSKSGNL